jgi:hypothetical protein
MANLECKPQQAKKTLMSAMENLSITYDRFEEIERLSNRLLEKFKRTEEMAKKVNEDFEIKQDTRPDIIDLFNDINDRFNLSINRIISNIEKVVDMIE